MGNRTLHKRKDIVFKYLEKNKGLYFTVNHINLNTRGGFSVSHGQMIYILRLLTGGKNVKRIKINGISMYGYIS